jgi:hypothetical protein
VGGGCTSRSSLLLLARWHCPCLDVTSSAASAKHALATFLRRRSAESGRERGEVHCHPPPHHCCVEGRSGGGRPPPAHPPLPFRIRAPGCVAHALGHCHVDLSSSLMQGGKWEGTRGLGRAGESTECLPRSDALCLTIRAVCARMKRRRIVGVLGCTVYFSPDLTVST